MCHLPLSQPRRPATPRRHRHHRHQRHRAHTTTENPHQHTPAPPPTLRLRPQPANPARADHRHHHRPAPARLDATRTRPNAQRPPPPPRHPASRMVPARLLHPHRPGHLPAQHAGATTILDIRARPLTTRHCVAARSAWLNLDPNVHSPGFGTCEEDGSEVGTNPSGEGSSSGLDPGPAKSARGAVPVFGRGPFPRPVSLHRRAHYLATAPDLAPEYLASKRPEKPPLVLVTGTRVTPVVWLLINDRAISAAVA